MKYLPRAVLKAFACVTCLLALTAEAGGIVTVATEANLRAALTGGGTVTFAVDGTITLASTLVITNDTVIDGTGRSVALSGGGATRLFHVTPGTSLTLKEFTLQHGVHLGSPGSASFDGAQGIGGAVFVDQSLLTLLGCRVWTNTATGGAGGNGNPNGSGGAALGGAIYLNAGVLNVTNSEFLGNVALGGPGGTNTAFAAGTGAGGKAWGGAVYASAGTLNLEDCRFQANQTIGGRAPESPSSGNAGASGEASGGAIFKSGGTLVVVNGAFDANRSASPQPVGPLAGSGGAVRGGAVHNAGGSALFVQTGFKFNQAIGGDARRHLGLSGAGQGGAIFNLDRCELTACTFQDNQAIGGNNGQSGSNGEGGGIFNGGQLLIAQTSFEACSANAGSGYFGGQQVTPNGLGLGGAICSTNALSVSASTLMGNFVNGARGGNSTSGPFPGSPAFGGAIYNTAVCSLTNNTLTANTARGGACLLPAPPPFTNAIITGGGDGFGGGIYNSNGILAVVNNTVASNSAVGGAGYPEGSGHGGGIAQAGGTLTLLNTILAHSLSGSNSVGALTDLGHNLSSDASCNFTSTGSLNSTDPKLGPLANYGGPTPTLPLLSASPAIDGGALAGAPASDQRGRARPFGSAVDIGALESSPPYVLRGKVSGATLTDEVTLTGAGTTSTSNGWFSLEGVAAGSYTVTPAHANYLFVPAGQSLTAGPDQLGVDFRAYRWNTLSLDDATNGMLHMIFAGTNGMTYRTLESSNLADWLPVSTNLLGPNQYFELLLPATSPAGFFRTVSP